MLKITKKYSMNRQKCPPLSLQLFLFTFLPKLTNDFSNSKKTQCHFGAVCNIQMSYVSAVQDRLVLLFNIISYRDSKLLRPVIILWQAKKICSYCSYIPAKFYRSEHFSMYYLKPH